MIRALVCTSMPIPHTGGASTHIEILCAVLKNNKNFAGIISRNDVKLGLFAKIKYILMRINNRDEAGKYALMSVVEQIKRKLLTEYGTCENLIIHCHDPFATCAALRANLSGVRIVQTVHGPLSLENAADGIIGTKCLHLVKALEIEAFANADLLLPVDIGQAEILRDDFNVSPERMRVINNAVDLEAILANHSHFPIPGVPGPYFLVPRRLVAKNGVEFALRAFAHLKSENAYLLIAGDGYLKPSLLDLTEKLEIATRTRFLGDVPRDHLISLMKGSIAVIVPSVPVNGVVEATSLAVLEAMACSVPVIGSAIGGIKDIIESDAFGMLTKPGNPKSIADAMQNVLKLSAEDKALLVSNAYKRVDCVFSVKRWQEEVFSAYKQAYARTSITE